MSEPEPKIDTKEAELQALRRDMQQLRSLIQHDGWKIIRETFIAQVAALQENILNNAARTELGKKQLDGMQGIAVEAMEKGLLKGIQAILTFPGKYIEQAQEQVEMLEKVISMKEDDDGN